MDTSDLFTSCKKGDVCRVRYLLEQRDVEINVRDKWDSTPLYYACLCGHEELVQYLLASGAKCEANTFDGERCLYGALSDAIRRVLKEYKQITAKCMKRDYYDAFLQRLLEQGYQSDIVFIVHGKSFCAHRCILGARSAYFAEMFETKWKGKNVIALKHPLINPAAFGSLLQYLYTGRLDIDVEYVNDCKRLAKQCRLQDLIEDLETKCKKVYEFGRPIKNGKNTVTGEREHVFIALMTNMRILKYLFIFSRLSTFAKNWVSQPHVPYRVVLVKIMWRRGGGCELLWVPIGERK